ncbi:MAG: hypothetical protein ACRYFZ_11980 [Janthinobacterium lividum]
MKVTLPIEDPEPTEGVEPELLGVRPIRKPAEKSLTQNTLEQVMAAEFPTVACLGIEVYVERLSRIIYTSGHQVFWLDKLPDLPGYTVMSVEPIASEVGADGHIWNRIYYKTGPSAAYMAEEMRRCIPPGKMHTDE